MYFEAACGEIFGRKSCSWTTPWRIMSRDLDEIDENGDKLIQQTPDFLNGGFIYVVRDERLRDTMLGEIRTCLSGIRCQQDVLTDYFLPDLALTLEGKPVSHFKIASEMAARDQEAKDKVIEEKKIKDKEVAEKAAQIYEAYKKMARDEAAIRKEIKDKEIAGKAAKVKEAKKQEPLEAVRHETTEKEFPAPGSVGWLGSLMGGMDKTIEDAQAKKDAVRLNTAHVDGTKDRGDTRDSNLRKKTRIEQYQQDGGKGTGLVQVEHREVKYCPDGHEHKWDVMAKQPTPGVATKICFLCGTSFLFLTQA